MNKHYCDTPFFYRITKSPTDAENNIFFTTMIVVVVLDVSTTNYAMLYSMKLLFVFPVLI